MFCPICLCSEKKLLRLPASLSDVFVTLLQNYDTNINLCWECIADLRHTNKFKKRALKSKHILHTYSEKTNDNDHLLKTYSQSNLITSNVIINCIPIESDSDLNENELKYGNCEKRIHYNVGNDRNKTSVIVYGQEKKINNAENSNVMQSDITHIKKVKHARNIIKSLKNDEIIQNNDTKDKALACVKISLEENNAIDKINKKNAVLCYSNTVKCVDYLRNTEINAGKLKAKKKIKVRSSISEFKCIECGEIFSSRGKYEYHKQKHRGRAACAVCARTFASRAALAAHALTAHGGIRRNDNSYRCYCQPCGKFFQSTSSYRKHLRTSSPHVDRNSLKYKCPKCNKLFLKQSDAFLHHDMVHLKRNLHACKECDARYCSVRALRAHESVKHRRVQKYRSYVCEVCGWAFKASQTLKSHLRKHLDERHSRQPKKT